MARIKNSMTDNVYGGGKEQILTTDDGRSYVIKNSATRNVHGGGYEKEIKECGSSDYIGACNPILMTIIVSLIILLLINFNWNNPIIYRICMIGIIVSVIIDVLLGFFSLGD